MKKMQFHKNDQSQSSSCNSGASVVASSSTIANGVATSLRRYIQDRPLGLLTANVSNRYRTTSTFSDLNAPINLMRDRLSKARNLFRKDLHAHYGCVNALEFSDNGSWLVSGGDDRRVLLWNVERAIQSSGAPTSMKGEHSSNIFCLAFDNRNTKIFSAGNDEQVIVHDTHTGETLDVFLHEEAVYGISVDPLNSNVFATACDDGRILIWDIREPNTRDPFCLASYSSAFHAVMYNPMEPRLLVTANSKDPGVSLWDVRHPNKWLLKYGSAGGATQSCMSVRFNQSGTQILALRRRLPPVLFDIHSADQICQFDHSGYYNSCTMKSCCFAGDDDQYVMSGSDDFNLYMWKIPEDGSNRSWVDQAQIVLRGHRSIVNQVRFNTCNFLLASSGVEKIIKLWSPFTIPRSTGGLLCSSRSADKQRKVYSHMEYINMVMHGGQVMTHDYSQRSTQEDPRMMAFFDSLVQREIEGLVSDDESDAGGASTSGGGGSTSSASSNNRSEGREGRNSDSWLYDLAGTAILSDIGSSDESSDTPDENDVDDDFDHDTDIVDDDDDDDGGGGGDGDDDDEHEHDEDLGTEDDNDDYDGGPAVINLDQSDSESAAAEAGVVAAAEAWASVNRDDNSSSSPSSSSSSSSVQSHSENGVSTNTISWMIRRKRHQLLEVARAKFRRDQENFGSIESGQNVTSSLSSNTSSSSPPRHTLSPAPPLPRRLFSKRSANGSTRRTMRSTTASPSTSTSATINATGSPSTTSSNSSSESTSSSSSSILAAESPSLLEVIAGPSRAPSSFFTRSSASIAKKTANRKCNSTSTLTTCEDRRKSLRKRRVRILQDRSSASSSDSGNSDSGVKDREDDDNALQSPRHQKRACNGAAEIAVGVVKCDNSPAKKHNASATSTPDSGIATQSSSEQQPAPTNSTNAAATVTKVNERFKRTSRTARGRRQYRSAPTD